METLLQDIDYSDGGGIYNEGTLNIQSDIIQNNNAVKVMVVESTMKVH